MYGSFQKSRFGNGWKLAGWEKQRIALARLLLKEPRVVVLDEATAHLDSESEAAVARALDNALEGRTSVVIAHRLSTISLADRVLLLEGGRIVASGTHTELLAYMSDNYLLSTALLPHALCYDSPEIQTASIDHGLWFYGDFRADEWLYYHLASPCAAGGRGFNIGSIYTRDGRLVATAVQEGLMHLHAED